MAKLLTAGPELKHCLAGLCQRRALAAALFLLLAVVLPGLTNCDGEDSEADFSAREELVYISLAGDDGNMYVAAVDGSGVQHLLDWHGYGERPSLSNDGRYLLISLSTTQLLAATDGSNVRLINDRRQPTFSPDSSRLAYVTASENGVNHVEVMNIDSGETRNLVEGEGGVIVNPTWVDDRTLIYTQLDIPEVQPLKAGGIIYRVDTYTGAIAPLTDESHSFSSYNAPVSYQQPAVALIEKEQFDNIWSLDVHNGRLRQVSNNTLFQFRAGYLPDSNEILFEQQKTSDDVMSSELCIMADDGSSFSMLTSNFIFDGLHSFSLESGKIAFEQKNEKGETSIWTMNGDGSGLTRIVEQEGKSEWLGDPTFAVVGSWQQKNPLELLVGEGSPDNTRTISITNPTGGVVAAVLRAFPGNNLELSPMGATPTRVETDAAGHGKMLEWKLELEPGETITVDARIDLLPVHDPESLDASLFITLSVTDTPPHMSLRYLD